MELSETPRDISVCGHAILGDGAFVIPDALQDERFATTLVAELHRMCGSVRAAPARPPAERKLGTLCIIDSKPRAFSDEDVEMLVNLALMVEREFSAIEWATVTSSPACPTAGFHDAGPTQPASCARARTSGGAGVH